MKRKRTASSRRWLDEHEADAYVTRARREGYRSRAVYKLAEIDERDKLVRKGMAVVDLGAAPGAWCQYLLRRTGGDLQLFGLDLLPIEPIEGAELIQGDFREDAVLEALNTALGAERKLDLVLSDMAPNMRGVKAADQPAMMYLTELAAEFAFSRLKPGGSFLVKLFQGEGFDAYLQLLRDRFASVIIRKPEASRARSAELYLLARNHRLV